MIEPIAHEEDRIDRQLIELENNPQAAHDTTICNLHKELETLADELKTPALDDPHEAEPACQGAIKRIQTLAGQERETSAGTGQTAATSDLEPHSVIGQYQILAKVGQGGMGAVYRVRHTKLDKIVALKVLPEDRLEKSDAVVRFEREMKAVGKIEHPHLVRALDAGEAEGSHYLVMEYVDGIDLSRLLKEQGTLSVADACELIRQAALGLQAAFQSGMVHRDIKPANLMLARQDYGPPIVKVLDLGLARLSDDSGQVEAELTADNQIMGTLDFMAPEQAGSSRRVDTRADVYSLGATLFTLLTGQPPFHSSEHQTIVQKLSALANQPLPSLRALRADVPQGLVQVVEKMLAKDRENRYAEPGDVAEALKPFANNAGLAGLLEDAKTVTSAIHSGRSTASWAISSTDATIRLKSPRRSRWAIAAVLLLVLVPLLVLYAGTILRFTTNQGELVIDVDDPDIEVQVIQNGVVVKDKTKDREFTLTAMNGEVEVYEKDGVKLATKEFQLTRGGKTTVRVWLEELADVRNAKAGPEKQETSPLDVPTKNFALEFQKDQITLESLRYDGSHPLTIEAWATPRQVHVDQPRVVFSSNAGLAMSLKGDAAEQTGFWSFEVWPPDYLKNPKVSPPLRLGSTPVKFTEIIGRPTHLAICLGDSRVALFINGQLAKQFKHEGLNAEKIQQDAEEIYKSSFLIGSGRGNGDSFDGRIDELRVSKVLRYGDNFIPAKRFEPDEHTLALYHFDEGAGDVLKDSSGNGHHGKIGRAKWVSADAASPTPQPDGVIANSIGMKFVLIPAGEFLMGSPEDEEDRDHDETRHKVRITKPFSLGVTEVTQGQWEAVMKSTPWKGKKNVKEDSDCPAVYVSYDDVVEFCKRLSQMEGRTYRLPTEAEWEYACRAGSTTAYCFGNDESLLGDYAWCDKNAKNFAEEQYAHRVGQKKPNAWRLFDMHGNVFEWCEDWWARDYESAAIVDPSGPSKNSLRVIRGGSWSFAAHFCRSAGRSGYRPDSRTNYLGFRVASESDGHTLSLDHIDERAER